MAKSSTTATPNPAQKAKFIEAAKSIGADDDEAVFKAKLGKIATAKPAEIAPKKK